ncbi:outer membrane beta-barrel protein [Salinarimonas soli]|uniref:outer membrane beta-barrel protein n=1 Tax=Salinarimonas soli TaxID=1638099 RepID=UPI001661F188|nr:outer membrane beta-barrel protein [Salinarimonas soli]
MITRRSTTLPPCLRLLLGAGLVLGAPGAVGAQEGGLGLRAGTAPTPVASELPRGAGPVRKGRPPQLRRTRPATSAVTRPPLRGSVARDVEAAVQPSLVGLPDRPAPAAPSLRRKAPEEDPWAPLGWRMGGLTILPGIEQSIGYDTNPNRVDTGAKGSAVHRTEAEVRLRSDWSRHALTGALRGSYSAYPGVDGANRPEGEGVLALRLDALRDTQIDLESRFRLDTQRPGSPELGAEVRNRPIVATLGASAGVTERFNRLSIGLRGSVDRFVYEDARLTSGTTLDQGDRELTQGTLRLRGSYEPTPGLIPFVEASVDTRVHDRSVDRSGLRRDSTGLTARVGTTFEMTRTLTGEVAAGYQARDYEDPRLRELRGPVGEAALIWAASPLTTVRLRGAALLEETTIPSASGAVTARGTLEVQHDLRRNLSVTIGGTLAETDYDGIRLREETRAGSVRVDYKLTRSVALRASFTHERLTSTSPGSDYTANVYLVGLRFQP